MIIIQFMIGLFVAVGVGMILADVFRIPTFKASKAAHNLGKKGEKRVSVISIYQKEIAGKLAVKLKLNEYKRAQLEADLKTAAMDVTPEEYTANAIVKAATIGIFAIPAFFLSKIVGMLALEYDRFNGYPDESTMQKQLQTYRALQAKAADLDQEKLNEKRMSIRPQKEEAAKKRISDIYGYCQDNFFRTSKNAVAKRLGEQPADIEKQESNKQTIPTPSWLRSRVREKTDRGNR